MSELWNKIAKANEEIELFSITRKQKKKDGTYEWVDNKYAQVKERVIAFRKVYPNGQIDTHMERTDNYIIFIARVYDNEGKFLAQGTTRELANTPFALENAETSAVGRALGFAGFGIKTGIASAEEIQNIESPSKIFENLEEEKENLDLRNKLLEQFNSLEIKGQVAILNFMKVKDVSQIKTSTLKDVLKTFDV